MGDALEDPDELLFDASAFSFDDPFATVVQPGQDLAFDDGHLPMGAAPSHPSASSDEEEEKEEEDDDLEALPPSETPLEVKPNKKEEFGSKNKKLSFDGLSIVWSVYGPVEQIMSKPRDKCSIAKVAFAQRSTWSGPLGYERRYRDDEDVVVDLHALVVVTKVVCEIQCVVTIDGGELQLMKVTKLNPDNLTMLRMIPKDMRLDVRDFLLAYEDTHPGAKTINSGQEWPQLGR